MRPGLNRVVVAAGMVVVLPLMAGAELLRAGCGRRVAVAAVRLLLGVCGVRVEVIGVDRVDSDTPMVFTPNHSSPLDIPVMLLARPDVRFMAGADLFRNPILARAMRAMDTIAIDRTNSRAALRQLTALCRATLRTDLVVFPEGGIAPAGHRLPFKRGAFVLAIATTAPVAPVAIRGTDRLLPPGAKLRLRPGTVVVEFMEPIPTATLGKNASAGLRDEASKVVVSACQPDRHASERLARGLSR